MQWFSENGSEALLDFTPPAVAGQGPIPTVPVDKSNKSIIMTAAGKALYKLFHLDIPTVSGWGLSWFNYWLQFYIHRMGIWKGSSDMLSWFQ